MGRRARRGRARGGAAGGAATGRSAEDAPGYAVVRPTPPKLARFLSAAVSSQLYKAALARDGPLARRQVGLPEATSKAARRPVRPCTLDEAVDDAASHIAGAFRAEPWSFCSADYADDVAHASLTAPLDEVVKMLCQEHGMTYDPTASSAPPIGVTPCALPDGVSTGSPLATIFRALPYSLQEQLGSELSVTLESPKEPHPYLPARDFETRLLESLEPLATPPTSVGEQQYNVVVKHLRSQIELVRLGLKALIDAPVEIRRPEQCLSQHRVPPSFELALGSDGRSVEIHLPAINEATSVCHKYGFLEAHAASDLPPLAADALRELCAETPDRGDTAPSAEEMQPLLGRETAKASAATASVSDADVPFTDSTDAEADARALANARARATRLFEFYTTISKSLANLRNAVPAMTELAAVTASVGDAAGGSEGGDGSDDGAAAASKGITVGRLRNLHDATKRNTHVAVHLKQGLTSQMQMCENAINALTDLRLRQTNMLDQRKKQRMEVEEKILRAGNRANARSVDRARSQIQDMERDEIRQQDEMSDHEDYVRHLSDSKIWIMHDLDIVGRLEIHYDNDILPALHKITRENESSNASSLPTTAPSAADLEKLAADALQSVEKLSTYIASLRERTEQFIEHLLGVRTLYLNALIEAVPKRSPLRTGVCRTVLQRAWNWRTRALELTWTQQQALEAEQQRLFEATLEAEIHKEEERQAAEQRRLDQLRSREALLTPAAVDEAEDVSFPVAPTSPLAPVANHPSASAAAATAEIQVDVAVAVTMAADDTDGAAAWAESEDWQEDTRARRRRARQDRSEGSEGATATATVNGKAGPPPPLAGRGARSGGRGGMRGQTRAPSRGARAAARAGLGAERRRIITPKTEDAPEPTAEQRQEKAPEQSALATTATAAVPTGTSANSATPAAGTRPEMLAIPALPAAQPPTSTTALPVAAPAPVAAPPAVQTPAAPPPATAPMPSRPPPQRVSTATNASAAPPTVDAGVAPVGPSLAIRRRGGTADQEAEATTDDIDFDFGWTAPPVSAPARNAPGLPAPSHHAAAPTPLPTFLGGGAGVGASEAPQPPPLLVHLGSGAGAATASAPTTATPNEAATAPAASASPNVQRLPPARLPDRGAAAPPFRQGSSAHPVNSHNHFMAMEHTGPPPPPPQALRGGPPLDIPLHMQGMMARDPSLPHGVPMPMPHMDPYYMNPNMNPNMPMMPHLPPGVPPGSTMAPAGMWSPEYDGGMMYSPMLGAPGYNMMQPIFQGPFGDEEIYHSNMQMPFYDDPAKKGNSRGRGRRGRDGRGNGRRGGGRSSNNGNVGKPQQTRPTMGQPVPANNVRQTQRTNGDMNGAAHGGAPHGGAPHGGAPHGGAPHGGAPHGGAPHGGAPHGAPRGVPSGGEHPAPAPA